ncbi:hypothetical protein D9M72_465650 [compost metagenome]
MDELQELLVPGLGHGHAHHPDNEPAAEQVEAEGPGEPGGGLVIQDSQFGHSALGPLQRRGGNGVDEDQREHGAGVGSHEVAGDDGPERVPQEHRVRSQAQCGHEIVDELPVPPHAVPAVRERIRAAEAGKVGHDEPHVRELVRYPEKAVVVAPESVDHQDGTGLGRHADRFIDPVVHIAAVQVHAGSPRPGVQLPAEEGRGLRRSHIHLFHGVES